VSKNLEKVVQRAISDAGFRRLLQSNPEAALRGFKLTSDEVAALKSGDASRLMSFGIDQRMSKTFSFSDVNMAHQASTSDLTSGVRGASLTDDPGTAGAVRGSIIDQDTAGTSRLIVPNANAGQNAFDPGQVDGGVGGIIGDPSSSSSSDAIEDQSHAFSASRSADLEGAVRSSVHDLEPPTLGGSGLAAPIEGSPEAFAFQDPDAIRSSVRDVEPTLLGANSASDAVEDTSHAFAARADIETVPSSVRDVEPTLLGANSASDAIEDTSHTIASRADFAGETVRSSVRDVEPTLLGANSASDAVEDTSHAFAARADIETVRSSVRDVEPTLLGANSASDAVEDTSHAFAARADIETVRSSVRDVEPTLLGANSASDAVEDTSHAFAARADIETVRSSVRDVEPTLLGANSASDAVEDTSHAFLASQDASRYAAEANIDAGAATDEGQVFSPGAETITDAHGDIVGNAGTSQEPDLSA